jgi:hypothetical protein
LATLVIEHVTDAVGAFAELTNPQLCRTAYGVTELEANIRRSTRS